MPELPEVQTVVDSLAPAVLGRRIVAIEILRQDFARPADVWDKARGQRVTGLRRRAKRILFTLGDGSRFFAHLGMTGRLTFGPRRRERPKHTHVCLHFAHGEVHFVDPRRFGGLIWLGDDLSDGNLGPEPLEIRPAELARRLERTRRSIKTALLDQRLIAGPGNIYVDEALFLAGIHPTLPADALSREQVGRLCRGIKATLRKAIRHRGSTLRDYVDADGRAGDFRRLHQVYGREGKHCNRCGKSIVRIVLGGRSTHFCPRCQPWRAQRGRAQVTHLRSIATTKPRH